MGEQMSKKIDKLDFDDLREIFGKYCDSSQVEVIIEKLAEDPLTNYEMNYGEDYYEDCKKAELVSKSLDELFAEGKSFKEINEIMKYKKELEDKNFFEAFGWK